MPAHEGGAARTGAGVRKPPMEETAGGEVARRCGDLSSGPLGQASVDGYHRRETDRGGQDRGDP
jgi:hypothetical protein